MLLEHMSDERGGNLAAAAEEDVSDLMALYRAAKARFDADEDFKQRSREAVTRLQSGGKAEIGAWQRIFAASRREFDALYDRLGISLEERGESYYNPFLAPLLAELQEAGVVEESEGAQVVWVDGIDIPMIMQKSDGGFGYASTDMAAIKHRIHEEKAQQVIYVTDVGQQMHFKQVFAAAQKAKLYDESRHKVQHVGFGLVLGDDGKRFRTRSGDLVKLVELLDEAYRRCKAMLEERSSAENANVTFTPEEVTLNPNPNPNPTNPVVVVTAQ